MKHISHSYFVALMDYGKSGFEALPVNPEFTIRDIVDGVLSSVNGELVHVKRIEGNYCEDVTEDVRAMIVATTSDDFSARSKARMQLSAADHARDYRKHFQAAE